MGIEIVDPKRRAAEVISTVAGHSDWSTALSTPEFDGHAGSSRSSRIAVGGAAALVGIAVGSDGQKAKAQFVNTTQAQNLVVQNGQQMAGIPTIGTSTGGLGYITFSNVNTGTPTTSSITVLSSNTGMGTSAFLFAGHTNTDINWSLPVTVGFGSNYLADAGPKLTIEQSMVRSPQGSSIDLAGIVYPAALLPNGRTLNLGTDPASLDVLHFGGYGKPGISPNPLSDQDGLARVGSGLKSNLNPVGFPSGQYFSGRLSTAFGLDDNIAGSGGSSGGVCVNDFGDLVGVLVAGTVGVNNNYSSEQRTTFASVTSGPGHDFALALVTPVPEPAFLLGVGVIVAGAVEYTRRQFRKST